ncbi:MAG: tetratricopeptide repeat protein [Thermomicrobiales bacterium]
MHTSPPPEHATGEFPSGDVAFLFADLAGMGGRWDADFTVAVSDVTRLVETLRQAATAHGGVVFKVVDASVQAAFHHPEYALSAAIAVASAYATASEGAALPRIALHIGEATPRNRDYLAPALNRLARLIAAGHPGQILLTAAAHGALTALPTDVSLLPLGRHRLRDLLEAEAVFQAASPGLSQDFPPLRSLDGIPHNMPIQANQLIGREADLARIRGAWRSGERLITLTGPGGVGKSRLSLQAAADNQERFPDGVWWAPLAAISDPALVLEAIAAALPLRFPADLPLAGALALRLRDRADLLILDNLEQVTAAAPQIERLLRDAPGLSILASSRIPLGLPEEFEIPVDPLPVGTVADSGTTPALPPAVQLFVERAAAVRPGFALTPDNEQDITAICARLDGLPLAVELAAARVRVLAPPALLARLDRSLSLLTGGARDLPGRQQTLRAAIQWSYDLLDPQEQSLFARLAVMAPGFTTTAAARVLLGETADPGDLEHALLNLQQQSLLRRSVESSADRWSMLSTIHEFASEQFARLPDAAALQQAHAATYLRIAAEADWFAASQDADVAATFEADHENYRRALETLRDGGAATAEDLLELTTYLADFWWVRGHASEGRRWLDTAISGAAGPPTLALARALAAAGLLAEAQSDLPAARTLQERALAIFRDHGYAQGAADALTGLAIIARSEGDLDRARALHQEAHAVWTALDDDLGAAGALLDLGVVSYLRGDDVNARPLLSEALAHFTAAGDEAGMAYAEQSLAGAAVMAGDLAAAAAGFQRSLALWEAAGNDNDAATDRMNLAEVLLLQGDLDDAESLLLTALEEFADLEAPTRRGTTLGLLGRVSLERGDPATAASMAQDALELVWQHRDRAATTAILDTMTEALTAQRDPCAGAFLAAGDALRRATGLKRAPAYAQRLAPVRAAHANSLPDNRTADELVDALVYRGFRR